MNGDKMKKVRSGGRLLLHVLSGLAVIGGIFRGVSAGNDALTSALMSQYLLWAILFQLVALNVKK